jgi:membrane associated rhomboid family serine protease
MQHDYRQHFLDDDDWMTDKNVRYWDVKLAASKTRGGVSFTSKLVLANIICYGIQSFYPSFTSWGVKLSDKILRGEELYRLLSPVFLHGGIYHLFTNMYSLTNVGPPMERLFGPGRYLAGYLVSGAAGNLLSAMQSPNPALGASGAVFGVMAGFYVFLSRHDWLLGDQGRAYTNGITQTLLINLVIGAMNPVVDNWGHLGGAIGGAAMAYYFGPRLYLADLPEGGRIVVDKPIMRLPRSIESIPEKVSARIQRITRRMQVWRFRSDLASKPWRPTQPGGPSDFQRRMTTPSKSIKPKQD